MADMVVIMEHNGGLPSEDSSGQALTAIVWRVYNVPVGMDPRDATGVPKKDSEITQFGTVFTCDKVDTPTKINDTTYRVATWFSTNRYWDALPDTRLEDDERNFQEGHKNVDVAFPMFHRDWITYTNDAGAEVSEMTWVREDDSFPIEWGVLSVNIILDVQNDGQILAYRAGAKSQSGHFHIFPTEPLVVYRMLTPEIQRLGKKMTIGYAWEGDPGNGPMKIPGANADELILPPARPPFHVYKVLAPLPDDPFRKPRIIAVPIYDTADTTYYTPNGYVGLPGNPI